MGDMTVFTRYWVPGAGEGLPSGTLPAGSWYSYREEQLANHLLTSVHTARDFSPGSPSVHERTRVLWAGLGWAATGSVFCTRK